MKLIFSIFLLSSVSMGRAQGLMTLPDRPFTHHAPKDTALLAWLRTSPDFNRLSAVQQDMVYWVDFMRTRPVDFLLSVYLPFLEQFPEAACPEAVGLRGELKSASPLPRLSASYKLSEAANRQAAWVSKTGKLTHNGPNGKEFGQRMKEAGIAGCGAENIFAGEPDVLVGLILLMIDKGVEHSGHRKNLLSPEFQLIGVGTAPYKNGQLVMDQIFACGE